jgi:indoleamine 2,3-dioxygenase
MNHVIDCCSDHKGVYDRGFLPAADPAGELPRAFEAWDELGAALPKLLAVGKARQAIERLPQCDVGTLKDAPHVERAMMLLSFFGHAAMWNPERDRAHQTVPAAVAVPWVAVARMVGRPPTLSYASHALANWRRLDPTGPLEIENLAVLQNFLGGMDEDWFILLHVHLEAAAAPAVNALLAAQSLSSNVDGDAAQLTEALDVVARCTDGLVHSLSRMRERCDPHVFFHRVQPFLHGLGTQVVYEGVESPGPLIGASAAQSPFVPFLDAALGIKHEPDALVTYLDGMRRYMPPWHREVIQTAEQGPPIRDHVLARLHTHPLLVETYNRCVEALLRFRSSHLEYPMAYIQGPASRASRDSTGTGGTPFMMYLKKLRDETARHRIA